MTEARNFELCDLGPSEVVHVRFVAPANIPQARILVVGKNDDLRDLFISRLSVGTRNHVDRDTPAALCGPDVRESLRVDVNRGDAVTFEVRNAGRTKKTIRAGIV